MTHPLAQRIIRILSLVAGVLAVATAVVQAVVGEWGTAVWALTAAMWITVSFIHRCPRPEPERGDGLIEFVGGPLDGATGALPDGAPDMDGMTFEADDHRYDLTVDHTCYRAEAHR